MVELLVVADTYLIPTLTVWGEDRRKPLQG